MPTEPTVPITEDEEVAEVPAKLDLYSYIRWRDIKQGILRIGDIEQCLVEIAISELREMRRLGLKKIRVFLMSPGGEIYSSLGLYDALQGLVKAGIEVEVTVYGYAASAAAMTVLQAGTSRRALPNSRFLLHEPRRWKLLAAERVSELEDETKEMKVLEATIVGILSERCKQPRKKVAALFKRKEVWMSALEAKDWGLIDEIIESEEKIETTTS